MPEIRKFPFSAVHLDDIKKFNFGLNWPVVYLINNEKEIYIGETTSLYHRSKQHLEKAERRRLSQIHVITDEEYNKSAALDIESSLIQYMAADGKYALQNGNGGLQNHNYYDRQRYQAKFEEIWEQLRKVSLAQNSLEQIKNSDLFKYSPYKSLSGDQLAVANQILTDIEKEKTGTYLVHGGPGTGKTILAIYLFKRLAELYGEQGLKVGLVVPMTSLRMTVKKVFKSIKGLKSNMVIGPSDVSKGFDVLIVDEAHRLRRRKNIVNFKSFDAINKFLGLNRESTELDWIMKCSKTQILFYDEKQSVRPSDVPPVEFRQLKAKESYLSTQLRIGTGQDGTAYTQMIDNMFDQKDSGDPKFESYDFRIYEDFGSMVDDIKERDREIDLCRIVSGYAWPWVSKDSPEKHDIEIDGHKLKWNSVNHNWVYSKNSVNEVGCIHTVQGYDLNYAGVIIGPELTYDSDHKKFAVHLDKYMDANGKRGIDDKKELERYIINIYKTLLTRGIKGTYVYIVDDELRKYIENKLPSKVI